MSCDLHVAQAPPKPLLVFDGDCHFCGLWIRRWRQLTGEAVDYLPAQDPRVAEQFPEIPRAQLDTAVQLIATDGGVYSGAEAVFRALAENPAWQWLLHGYETFPLFAGCAERAYRLVAEHRPLFSTLTRWCWGRHVEQPSYFLVRWLFLRALGVVYFFAFLSLGTQIAGLIGHDGILPAGPIHGRGATTMRPARPRPRTISSAAHPVLVQRLRQLSPSPMRRRRRLVRRCCWPDWRPCLVSLCSGCSGCRSSSLGATSWVFNGTACCSKPVSSPFSLRRSNGCPGPCGKRRPSRLFVWLLRLLLFKLMFSSGCVKLLSGDPNWRNLTALTFHYQTQPLPPWTAWYANQLPLWFQKLSCAAMFAIEIGAPFLIFAPRRLRFLGAALLAWLQLLILLTGNYAYFNWLSLALCLLLLDDFLLEKIVPPQTCPLLSPGA